VAGDGNDETTAKLAPPTLRKLPESIVNLNKRGGEAGWVKILKAEDELSHLVDFSGLACLVGEKRK